MARQLAFKTRALRENDPYQRPVFSHADTPRIGSGAEWRWARVGDFFGTSNYPKWNNGHPWDDPVESEDAALLQRDLGRDDALHRFGARQ